jgi:hypothetical protein
MPGCGVSEVQPEETPQHRTDSNNVANEASDRDTLHAVLDEEVVNHIPGPVPFGAEQVGGDTLIRLRDEQKDYLGGKPHHAETYNVAVIEDHVIMLAEVTAERAGQVIKFRRQRLSGR